MNIPLAIGLQVVGSFLFASGATLQHLGVKGTFDPNGRASSNRLTFAGMLRLFLIPKWLLGLLFVLCGAGFHLYALTMAPVAVVQPVGILAVPWSVLLAQKIHGHKVTLRIWGAVAITIVGVVGFTVFSSLFATAKDEEFNFTGITWAFLVVCGICAILSYFATRAAAWARAILWSSVGAIFYGLASGMMKAAMNLVQDHGKGLLEWDVLVVIAYMIACYGLGVWMIQQGYASGPAETVVGALNAAAPVAGVAYGIAVLGEGSALTPAAGVLMLGFAAVAIWGVVLLSRIHPVSAGH